MKPDPPDPRGAKGPAPAARATAANVGVAGKQAPQPDWEPQVIQEGSPPASADSSANDAARGDRWPDRIILVALGLVVASTIALAAYTTAIHLRTNALRREARAVTTPAVTATQDLIIAATLELDGLFHYALEGDTAGSAGYARGAAARHLAAARVARLMEGAQGESGRRARVVMEDLARWEAAAPDTEAVATMDRDELARRLPGLQAISRDVLLDATALERALSVELDRARARIDAAELEDWYFTIGLVVVAFGASVLVVVLLKRVRRLAEISEHRRIQAEQVMESRARLVRGITHDLKNPLGAADGAAQLLELGVLGTIPPQQREMVQRIRRGIAGALATISDLLELSRAEAGRLEMHLSPADPGQILADAAEEYRAQAEASGITLERAWPQELPGITTDVRRVRGIVGNLISNGVKYTPAGGRVTLSAAVASGDAAPGAGDWLTLSVADTGPGIAREDRERIFEEFQRVGTAAHRAQGAGLGLAISRRIARLLGGDLTVESELGKGSVFTLWLPLRTGSAEGRSP